MFNGWNITSIILPTSIMTIGRYAFQSCIKLLSISIPETVTTISDYALSGCSSLTTLILPEGLTFIGGGLLWDCTGLSSITLPQSITSIGTHAFTNCKKLVSLEIPESVTKIGDYVFLDCECLTSIILPKGISFIGGHAFENCISLTSITIPNEVITISSCAFRHCDSLNSVVLSEKIATIGSEAFRWCGNLTSISIPESIYEIEDDAFKDCTSMTSIYIYSNDPPRSAPGIFDNTNDAPIYVPSQSLTAYKSADIWSVYSDRIFVLPPTAVDLGLSVKWASMNVGALTPEGFGDYYAWGETETKDDYSWITYKFRISGDAQDNVKLSKYVTEWAFGEVDNKSVLDPEDDVAHVKFGGNWRIPTKEEQDELRNQCTWTWTTVNGVKGYEVKSNVNSNSIFLPAAGHRYSTQLMYAGSLGYYGSASLSLPAHPIYAGRIYFHSNGVIRDGAYDRYAGFPVRPVTE